MTDGSAAGGADGTGRTARPGPDAERAAGARELRDCGPVKACGRPGGSRPRRRGDAPTRRPRASGSTSRARPRRSLLPEYDPEAFGRLSERIARFLGTGRFIVWMTVVIIAWVAWNIFAPRGLRFDQYPFIFLTLMLSLQASYAAPLILLAQNRQDDRDRVNLEQDRKQNERSIADTEYLTREIAALRMGLGEVATRDWIRSELQDLLKELDDAAVARRATRPRRRTRAAAARRSRTVTTTTA